MTPLAVFPGQKTHRRVSQNYAHPLHHSLSNSTLLSLCRVCSILLTFQLPFGFSEQKKHYHKVNFNFFSCLSFLFSCVPFTDADPCSSRRQIVSGRVARSSSLSDLSVFDYDEVDDDEGEAFRKKRPNRRARSGGTDSRPAKSLRNFRAGLSGRSEVAKPGISLRIGSAKSHCEQSSFVVCEHCDKRVTRRSLTRHLANCPVLSAKQAAELGDGKPRRSQNCLSI